MAKDLNRSAAETAAPPSGAVGTPARPAEDAAVYPHRFRIAYLALAVVLGAAVGTFILLLERPADEVGAWSAWKPTASGEARAWQIADHVAAQFTLRDGSPLVRVGVRPPRAQLTAGGRGPGDAQVAQDVEITAIAVQGRASDGSETRILAPINRESTVMYLMCGSGENCALTGRPSAERLRLLQRESLELALYTFRYDSKMQNVVIFLPTVQATPANGEPQQVNIAAYFRRRDLGSALERPLRATFPSAPAAMTARERDAVRRLADPRMFEFDFQRGQQGDAFLIFARVT